jgi:hypothetical protein
MPSSAWRLVSLSLVLLAFLFIGSPSFPALERAIQKAFTTSVVTTESATPSVLLHAAPHPEVVALPSDAPLAPAQRKAGILVPLYVSFAALQVLDAHSTMRALSVGATEGNPLMAGLAGKPAAFVAVKAGLAASTIFLAEKLRARSRRGAVALMAVLNSVYATIVAHNYRVPR